MLKLFNLVSYHVSWHLEFCAEIRNSSATRFLWQPVRAGACLRFSPEKKGFFLHLKPAFSEFSLKIFLPKIIFLEKKKSDKANLILLPFSFSEQLYEIRRVSMARVICDNSDELETIQPNAFLHVLPLV